MKTKFILSALLGILSAIPSQANVDPIRAGIAIGGIVTMGAIDKAKCSFADKKFKATEVKAPYVNLATSTISQVKSAPKGTKLKVAGEVSYRGRGTIEKFITDEFLLKDKKETLNAVFSNDMVCGVGPLPYGGEKVYLYGEKNANGGLDVKYWAPQSLLERNSWNYATEHDYPSFQVLQQTAEQTDSYYAHFLLAKAYYDGKLTAKNDKKAFEWAKKSYEGQGEQNNFYRVASPLLGILYAEGKGTTQNWEEAKHLLDNARQNSRQIDGFEELYGKAIYYYGLMHYQGKGVAKDRDRALQILHLVVDIRQEKRPKSAEAEALYHKLHEEKYRMPYSPNQHHITLYFKIASEHFEKGEHKKALELFEKLGNAGDTDSQVMAGLIYYTSDQMPQNVAKAKEWYLKAIEYKHPVGAYNLGVIYEDENNHKKAKYYYQKSCEWEKEWGEESGCEALKKLK